MADKLWFLVKAKIGHDEETLGLFKPSDHTLREMAHMQFRRDGRTTMVGEIWANQISKAEFDSYLEMELFHKIEYGAEFDHPCGLHIRVVYPNESAVSS